MSNLSNLMISGSYLGLINLQDSTQRLASQSGDVDLQDGVGDNIGLKINAQTKEFTVVNDLKVDGNVIHNGDVVITGSLSVRDDNAPMSGIILENNSGTGIVQILPAGDFSTTFNSATMTGIENYGGNTISGSWGQIGDIPAPGIGILNAILDGSTQTIYLSHGNYDSWVSAPNGTTTIKGDTIQLQPSSSAEASVEITGNITAGTGSFDTINARVLHVTTESASVIFSSGSNVLGDEETDRQDLIGQVIVSGTLGLEGNASFTGSLTVSNEISSSTLNGLGNVTIFSASVDTRLDALEADTGSQDSRIDNLENFTASQETLNGFYNSFTSSQENINGGYNTFTSSYFIDSASFDLRLDQQEAFSSSLSADFINTTEFNSYTSSTDNRLNNIEIITASIEVEQNVQNNQLSNLEIQTGSQDNLNNTFATTGSNVFKAEQTITGSVYGNVTNITIASSTASIDLSQGNFFTVNLPSGDTHLTATNIEPGQTVSLRVQIDGSGRSVSIDESKIKFASGLEYEPSISSSYDLLSFISFDDSAIYGVAQTTFDK